MVDWNNRIQTIKGNIGENIVKNFLEDKGFIVYKPLTEGPHAFDLLAIKDKKQIIVAEIKSQAKRNYYNDTGVSLRHYEDYQGIKNQYNLPIFLFFVDEMLKKIYGNWLSELEKPYYVIVNNKKIQYPLTQKGSTGHRVYFSLNTMITIKKITDEDVQQLRKLSTRSYEYEYDDTS